MGKPLIMVCANQAWNLVNFREGVIRSLVEAGWEVMAVAPPAPVWQARLEEMGCRFQPLPLDAVGANPLREIILVWRLWRLMRQHRPTAWLSWTIKPNAYGALVASFLDVKAFPNVSGLGTAFLHSRLLGHLARLLYTVSFRRCPTVFFQNGYDLALFVDRGMIRPGQARLLPGSGVDLQHFSPRPQARTGGEGPHFLMIARVLADKGVREFVEAARLLKASHPHLRFNLMGPAGVANRSAIPREEIEAWVAQGLITWKDAEPDVRSAIAAADWIVLPSYREGLSRVLVEAAAMGRPIITTDVPGCRDVVVPGANGWLVQPRNAGELAHAMASAAAIPETAWATMSQASRCLAEERYGIDRVIGHYRDALAAASLRPGDG